MAGGHQQQNSINQNNASSSNAEGQEDVVDARQEAKIKHWRDSPFAVGLVRIVFMFVRAKLGNVSLHLFGQFV